MEQYILIVALIFMVISKMDFLRSFRLSVHPIVYFLISVFLFGILGGMTIQKYFVEGKEKGETNNKPGKKINNNNINNGFNNPKHYVNDTGFNRNQLQQNNSYQQML